MFVNDTSHLPDSGRVCVRAFNAAHAPAQGFYSLTIVAARATVEPMGEPRNPAHVLGVGAEIESVKGPVFAAYFAATRDRFDAQPNYRQGLYVMVDGAVYAVASEKIVASMRRGFSTRELTLSRGDRPQRSVRYRWPWYREPFMSAKPGLSQSRDFLRELSAMVQAYR
jgi:hypothetical protein